MQSPEDRREYHLHVTQKYIDYYNISIAYVEEVCARIQSRFPVDKCAELEKMLAVVSRELMADVGLPGAVPAEQETE